MDALNRCWLGAPLPAELTRRLGEAQTLIKKRAGSDAIRWLPASEMALYLVSVGEVSPATITKIQVVARQVVARHKPMALTLEGVGASPNVTMPKTAWIGVGGEKDKLIALQRDLAVCCRQLITAIDDKPFEPTIEIGLLRKFEERARTEMGRSIKMTTIDKLGEFTLGSVHLLAAKTGAMGPSLQSVFELPLSS